MENRKQKTENGRKVARWPGRIPPVASSMPGLVTELKQRMLAYAAAVEGAPAPP
jgi:hypothetical protein